MIVFVFGDSITQGYWDPEGGWADKLKAFVHRTDAETNLQYYHGLHNLGIDGNTTKQVLERFDNEVKARLWPGSEYGVIIAVGTNDTIHRNHQEYHSTPEQYKNELAELYQKARKLTSSIAFVNLLPVDESLTNPLPSSTTGKCFTNERIEQFNTVLEDFCDMNDVTLLDVRSKFLGQDYKKLFVDGAHPNNQGHTIIYATVLPLLKSWLY